MTYKAYAMYYSLVVDVNVFLRSEVQRTIIMCIIQTNKMNVQFVYEMNNLNRFKMCGYFK